MLSLTHPHFKCFYLAPDSVVHLGTLATRVFVPNDLGEGNICSTKELIEVYTYKYMYTYAIIIPL